MTYTVLKHLKLKTILLLGFLFRTCSAYFGYGWFAMDDYVYAIEPAWQWLADPLYPYPSELRLPILSSIIYLLFRTANMLGIHEPIAMLRLVYFIFGTWSLLGISGVYYLAKPLSEKTALFAAFLTACGFMMPHISTRALPETLCLPFIVWGLVAVQKGLSLQNKKCFSFAVTAGLLLGTAVIIRFQTGLITIGVITALAVMKEITWLQKYSILAGLIVGGGITAGVLGSIDLLLGRSYWATPITYFRFNLGSSAQFGISPWYTYILQLLLFSVPPTTLLLLKPFIQALKQVPMIFCTLVLFIGVHSMIGHKEDRFIFSILPLYFMPLAYGLVQLHQGTRLQRLGFYFFLIENTLLLLGSSFSNANQNLVQPMLELANVRDPIHLATIGVQHTPTFYSGKHFPVKETRSATEFHEKLQDQNFKFNYLLARPIPDEKLLQQLQNSPYFCSEVNRFEPDFVDQILIFFNSHNKRRGTSVLLKCL